MNIKRAIKKLVGLIRKDADSRNKLLNMMPPNSVCAEIGVWKGEFSRMIASQNQPTRLHLIDPWMFQTDFGDRLYGGKVAQEQRDMDAIYQSVVKLFEGNDSVKIHRGFSDVCVTEFEDDYFDWVYIDGNHYYEYVLKDLEMYFSKVKRGGYLAGDDYTWMSPELGGDLPVKRAVNDFLDKMKDKVQLIKVMDNQFVIQKV